MTRGRVTLQDIAADAGVSRATVSLVVRESPLVADATRARVLASMDRLGYVYHRGAASLRGQRSKTLGLIVTDVSNPFFAEVTAGVEAEVAPGGYVLLLGHNYESLDKQARLLQTMREYSVDGVLLCPAYDTTAESLAALTSANIPLVLIARHAAGARTGYVGADNALGAELATEHLLEHGARRVAFLGGPDNSSARAERRRGVEAALARRRRGLRPELSVPSPASRQGGYEAAMRVLRRPTRPDAIVCYSDVVAFGVLDAVRELGLKPGEDVRVTGFDDIADAAHQSPPLTTVSTRPRDLGRRAGRQLKALIEYSTATPSADIVPATLAVRESCGCQSVKDAEGERTA